MHYEQLYCILVALPASRHSTGFQCTYGMGGNPGPFATCSSSKAEFPLAFPTNLLRTYRVIRAASEKVELGVVGVALVVLGELRELRDLR